MNQIPTFPTWISRRVRNFVGRRKECSFNQLARLYDVDVNNIGWDAVALNRETWTEHLR